MTPERKEEIKKYAAEHVMVPTKHVVELLAALEEAEQQITDIKTINVSLVRTIQAVEEERDDKASESDTFYEWWEESKKDRDRAVNGLAEAQQTIARQREALEFYASGKHIELNAVNQMVSAESGYKARESLGETQP